MSDRDEMGERMKRRFEDEADDQDNTDNLGNQDNPDNPVKSDTTDKTDKQDGSGNRDKIDPKEDWTGRMVYVPDGDGAVDDLLEAFDGEYDRMQYETDWEVRKQLHYYPVLVQVGTDRLEAMSGDEFTEIVDELGLR